MARIPEAKDLIAEAERIANEPAVSPEVNDMARIAIAVLKVGSALVNKLDEVQTDLSSIKNSIDESN